MKLASSAKLETSGFVEELELGYAVLDVPQENWRSVADRLWAKEEAGELVYDTVLDNYRAGD
jgi:hypothetical protein